MLNPLRNAIPGLLLCLASVSLSPGQTYFTEDFSANTMPPQGWSVASFNNLQNNLWRIDYFNNTPDAGGVIPEALFICYLPADGTSRLISPVLNLAGVSDATLSFKHKFNWYNDGPVIGVATRFGSGPWNPVWQVSPSASTGSEVHHISLGNIGQPDFQFCFFVSAAMTPVGNWLIDDIRLSSPPSLDAGLSGLKVPAFVQPEAPFSVRAVVRNEGLTPIHSFDFSWSSDGGPVHTQHFSGLNLDLGDSVAVVHEVSPALPAPGNAALSVFISQINEEQDANQLNDSVLTRVSAVTFVPHKMVLGEVATGTWCGFCVRSGCFLDYMSETYPNTWIGVAMHNNDPMMNIPYNNAIPQIIPGFDGGYPGATSDRTRGNNGPEKLEAGYLKQIEVVSPATIEIHNYSWDPVNRQLSFDVQSEFVADVPSELRFGAIITEDSVTGYSQANHYSGGANGVMCGFENLPNPIPPSGIHFDHVGRAVLDNPFGTQGSLPSPLNAGDVYAHHYECEIPLNWNYNKISVIGFLRHAGTGQILNATNIISSFTGRSPLLSSESIRIFPNPVQSSIIIYAQTSMQGAEFTVYDHMGRRVKSGKLREGQNEIAAADLPAGFYLFSVGTGKRQTFKIIKE